MEIAVLITILIFLICSMGFCIFKIIESREELKFIRKKIEILEKELAELENQEIILDYKNLQEEL